jgi:hypothetical protein
LVEIRGEHVATWLEWKNGNVYALVQALPRRLWIAGAVNVGAEIVDERIAKQVLFQAA